MSFLNPAMAIVAACVAVPALLILYFLKLKRTKVEVSSTLLWKQAVRDYQANAPFQKLRRNLLLLLQILALLALLAALSRPEISALTSPSTRHVLLIDRSASMQASDGDPQKPGTRTRLEVAQEQALALVDSLREPGVLGGEGDQAMVMTMDVGGTVLQNFTTSKTALARAIEGITPADTPTSIADAFTVAKAFLPKRVMFDNAGGSSAGPGVPQDERTFGQVSIHLFSDGRIPDIGSIRPQGTPGGSASVDDEVIYHRVGDEKTWNIGITTLRAERNFDKPGVLQVYAGIQSTALTPKSVDVHLVIDGQVAAIRGVELPAAAAPPATPGEEAGDPVPGSAGVVFTVDRPQGGVVNLRLVSPQRDALSVDDDAFVIAPPARRLAVALVSPGNALLREVLEKMPLSRPVLMVRPEQWSSFITSPDAGAYDVIVLDRFMPAADAKHPEALPPGRYLCLGASPPGKLGYTSTGEGEPATSLSWERTHPLLRHVGMDSLVVGKATRTALPEGTLGRVLVEGSRGVLIGESSDPARRVVFTTFDVLQSNWPLDAGYVIFVASSLQYLAQDGSDTGSLAVRPGGQIDQRLPDGATNVRLIEPDQSERTIVPGPDAHAVYGPVTRTGIYTLTWTGRAVGTDREQAGAVRRSIASNLTDAGESVIGARRELATASRVVTAQDPGQTRGTVRLWPWALLGVLLVMMIEWWVWNRRG